MPNTSSRFGKASIDGGGSVPITTRPVADPWVGPSLLRKPIRRGDVGCADRAAIPLYRLRSRGNSRRFLVVAFEGVGVGSAEVLVETALTRAEPSGRVGIGGDERGLCPVARPLANPSKDRSTNRLIGVERSHPASEGARGRVGATSLARHIEVVADMSRPLPQRAIAARFASGIEPTTGPDATPRARRPPALSRTGSPPRNTMP